MTIYYVDPINGDNANDGLTPSTSKTDFSTISGTEIDPVVVYIRRGTVMDMSVAYTMTWMSIVSWPNSDSYYFTDRPIDGINSGWDDDIPTLAEITDSYSNTCITISEATSIYFYDITFTISNYTLREFIKISANEVNLSFTRCYFYLEATNRDEFIYLSGSTPTLAVGILMFDSCEIYEYDLKFIGTLLSGKGLTEAFFINTKIENINRGTLSLISNSRIIGNILVDGCTVNIKNDFIGDDGYVKIGDYAKIINSNIESTQGNVFYSGVSYTDVTRKYTIENSSVSTLSNYVIHAFNANPNIRDISTINCVFEDCGGFLNSSITTSTSSMEISLSQSIFRRITQPIFNFTAIGNLSKDVDSIRRITTGDECEFINCTMFYKDNLEMYPLATLGFDYSGAIKNASFSNFSKGSLVIGELILLSSTIGSLEAYSGFVNVDFCSIGNIKGVDYAKIKRSTCESGISELFSNVSIEVSDSVLIAPNITGENTFGKIVASAISGTLSSSMDKNISIDVFDCKINDITLPYAKASNKFSRTSSPEYRLGGAGSSIKTSTFPDSSLVTIDEFYAKFISGSSTMVIYIALSSDVSARLSATLDSHTDTGYSRVVSTAKGIDNSSQWDGIPIDSIPFYFEFDISALEIIDDSLVEISISIEAGSAVSIWSDPIVSQQ